MRYTEKGYTGATKKERTQTGKGAQKMAYNVRRFAEVREAHLPKRSEVSGELGTNQNPNRERGKREAEHRSP